MVIKTLEQVKADLKVARSKAKNLQERLKRFSDKAEQILMAAELSDAPDKGNELDQGDMLTLIERLAKVKTE